MTPATRRDSIGAEGEERTYVTFDLSGQCFGVPVTHVREILDSAEIRPLPNAPNDVEGIIDLRGAAIPVITLADRLALSRTEQVGGDRVIVLEAPNRGTRIAVAVAADTVRNVATIRAADIEPVPAIAAVEGGLICGFARAGRVLIMLLDIDRLFLGERALDPAL